MSCGINVGSACMTLGWAAMSIKESTDGGCSEAARARNGGMCAQSIASVVGAFAYTGAFLAEAVTACGVFPNIAAQCAHDVQGVIGAITELAKNAADISFTCPPNQAVYGDYVEHKMQQHQNSILHKLFPKKKDTRIGLCFFDAGFGAATLAEAGISIRDSTLDCPINGEEKMCGSDIEMVMGAFSLVGTFVSRATSNCGNHRNVEAECASDITGIYGWMNVLGHHAAAMSRNCDPKVLKLKNTKPWEIKNVFGEAGANAKIRQEERDFHQIPPGKQPKWGETR